MLLYRPELLPGCVIFLWRHNREDRPSGVGFWPCREILFWPDLVPSWEYFSYVIYAVKVTVSWPLGAGTRRVGVGVAQVGEPAPLARTQAGRRP